MSENPRRPGTGRGNALLEMLKQRNAEANRLTTTDNVSPVTTPVEQRATSAISLSASTLGRGRANVIDLMKTMKVSEAEACKSSAGPIGQGRASLLGLAKKIASPGLPLPVQKQEVPSASGDPAGVLGTLRDLSICTTDIASVPSEPISRQGTSGTSVTLSANYINVKIDPGKGLFQYEVKFSPDIDSRPLRRKLLNQHSSLLGRTKTFDGVILYLPTRLNEERTMLYSEHPMDGSEVTLTIIYQKQQAMSDNVQFFNVLLARVMRALSLVRIGRQTFNPGGAHPIPQHRLEVWPGYVTAIDEYEGGLKLCIDAKHRVMRTDTVLSLMEDIVQRRRDRYRDNAAQELIGVSVLTRYNNKTYRIDDIEWDKNPLYEFDARGTKTSLIDYYRNHWNLQITNKTQPLLVHRAKDRLPTGEKQERLVLLVPELCYITGLTDNIRSDFRIMKDLDAVTKVSPNNRRDVIIRFLRDVESNEVTRNILSEWGLKLDHDILEFTGRTLDPEIIIFGQEQKFTPTNAEWSSAAVRSPVLRTPHLRNWCVVYCHKDTRVSTEFIQTLRNVSQKMCIQINEPHVISLKDDKTDSYVTALRRNIQKNVELMVTILPSNRTDRYSAIKKLCCAEIPVPSQVIISRTISRADKLKSITEKIALQINCKLGGALWLLQIPLNNCMVCGIDVYHSGPGQRQRSVVGFVASLDKYLTKWHSKVAFQGPHQEFVDLLQMFLVSAIKAYHEVNQCKPDRIVVYRDGVGDGQLEVVAKYEVKQLLLATFTSIDTNYKPHLSIVIVQKRINTRLFMRGRSGLQNPPPGTIVDSCVTRRNYYDFFLVAQNIRQGTVTPTHYIVIYDGMNMKPDHMQRLTYKLCHLYYNWPGTIKVPAPCQYAHKLAYLVGQNIDMMPHESLSHNLYYL